MDDEKKTVVVKVVVPEGFYEGASKATREFLKALEQTGLRVRPKKLAEEMSLALSSTYGRVDKMFTDYEFEADVKLTRRKK